MEPAGKGQLVVLRYHFVPHLRSRPACPLEPVRLEGDPVPLLGLRPASEVTTVELVPLPR